MHKPNTRDTVMAFSFNFNFFSKLKQNCNKDTLDEKEENENPDTAKTLSQAEVSFQLAAVGKACRPLYSYLYKHFFGKVCIFRLSSFMR